MKLDVKTKGSNKQRRAAMNIVRWQLLPLLLVSSVVSAATFNQTDWSTGVTANTAVDPTNQTGWTEASSKDAGIATSTDLTISPAASSVTHTRTDSTEFGTGINFQTHNTKTDFSGAGTLLTDTQVNNGAVGIKPATLVSAWADKAGTAWDVTLPYAGANAFFADLDGDGDLDMMAASSQRVHGYRNTGTDASPAWTAESGWDIAAPLYAGSWVNNTQTALGDMDGDGDYDLLLSHSGRAIHAFENTGDSSGPVWTEKTAWNLASGETATVAWKLTLADLDGDGVPEALIGGNHGSGVTNVYSFDETPADTVTYWVREAAWDPPGGAGYGAVPRPAAGDLDGDGLLDLTVGWRTQTNLMLVTNTGTASAPAWSDNGFTGAGGVGTVLDNGSGYDYPALVDFDSDGDLDIMVGLSGSATLTAYENSSTTYNTAGTYTSAVIDTGSGNVGYTILDYSVVTPAGTTLSMDVRSGPTASPDAAWTDWADNTGITNGADISAMGSGRYFQYRANMSTTDTSVTPLLTNITVNYTAYPLATSVNYAGNKLSLLPTNAPITWTTQTAWDVLDVGENTQQPALGDLDGDGVLDLVLGDNYGYEAEAKRGTGSPFWTTHAAFQIDFTDHADVAAYHHSASPRLADLDGDGDLDALVGVFRTNNVDDTTVHAYENTGSTSSPVWTHKQAWELTAPTTYAYPAFADLDNDGDFDLILGNKVGWVVAYRNDDIGSGPVWTANSAWDMTGDVGGYAITPELADVDGDGDYDLFLGDATNNKSHAYENVGTITNPVWNNNDSWDVPGGKSPAAADFDDDGDIDFLVGNGNGQDLLGYQNSATRTYASSGTFESGIIDFAGATFTTLGYTENIRTGTGVTVSVRAGNTATPGGVWTGWTAVANGGDISGYNGYRYMQYKVAMTANGGNSLSPEVADVSINYTSLPSPSALISSAYDTGVVGNFVIGLSWTETLVASSAVQIQLRTSPDNATWTAWVGPDGTNATYWNSANNHGGGCSGTGSITCSTMASMFKDGASDQWFQYQVSLVANGATTPTFSDVTLEYVPVLPPGITLSKTTGLVTTEALGTDTFTVVLDSAPTADVTITLSSDTASEAEPTVGSLTFTPSGGGIWSTPQLVTIAGVGDLIDDGDIGFIISVNPSSAGDAAYDALATLTVTGTNTDDDTAGVTVTPTSGLTVSESGTTNDTFTVVLDSQPLADVVAGLSVDDVTEATVSPASLVFTPANWFTAQTVTVTAIDDGVDDGDIAFNVVTAVTTSAGDGNYHGLNPDDVSVTAIDDDTVAIIVNPVSTLTTTEAGGTDSFTVVLGSEPLSNVTITATTSNGTEGVANPGQLTFSSGNWNVPQTITVTGNDDGNDDGDIYYTIFLGNASSADPTYDGYVLSHLTAVNADDDSPGIVVSPSSGLVTTEAGGVAFFRVSLNSQPTALVTVSISSNDAGEGSIPTTSIVFDSGNWDQAQPVSVVGVNDPGDDGDVVYTVTVATVSGGDTSYNAVASADVTLTNVDDDGVGVSGNAFSQSNWSVGTVGNAAACTGMNGVWVDSQCTLVDPDNQSGWLAYYSKENGIEVVNAGADLRSAIASKTLRHSSNADFAISASAQTFTTYDEFSTGASLSTVQVNNGAVALTPTALSASWATNAAWDHTLPTIGSNASFADLDGDSDLDMIAAGSQYVYGYRNTGSDANPVWAAVQGWNIGATTLGWANAINTALADIDQDGDYDLLLAHQSQAVVAFENTGDASNAIWTRKSEWDLASATGLGNPYKIALDDLTGNGVPDLIVGGLYSSAKMVAYSFNGTTWVYQSTWNPPGIYSSAPKAAIGDFDGDGDPDITVGWGNKTNLQLITNNNAGLPSTPNNWTDSGFTGALISNGTAFDYPGLADMDGDGDLDLMIGASDTATMLGYENNGTIYNASGIYTSPTIDTGSHDGFTTLDYTASIPANTTLTIDVRAADSADLVTTNATGWITGVANGADVSAALGSRRYFQYRANLDNTDTAVTPVLTDLAINYVTYPYGDNVVAANDALSLEILSKTVVWTSENAWDHDIGTGTPDGNNSYPKPSFGDIDGDGDLDMLRGDNWSQKIGFYENDGTNTWNYRTDWKLYCCGGWGNTIPALADMDNDGDLDVMLGSVLSTVVAFENLGDASAPVWDTNVPADQRLAWNIIKGGNGNTSIDLADLDGDGDLDAMVGDSAGTNVVWAYENIGTKSAPAWQANSSWNLYESQCLGCNWYAVAPAFADLDGDGDFDVILANRGGDRKPYAYRNVGDSTTPLWERYSDWDPVNTGIGAFYELADLDDDGDVDLLHGSDISNIDGYRNTGVTTYAASGSYTSEVLEIGGHLGFTTVDYDASIRTGTTLSVEIRSGNTADPSGWAGWQTFANGADISAFGTNSYVQYRVNMAANGANTAAPSFYSIGFNYSGVALDESLISNPYDTTVATNLISGLAWSETLAADTDVRIQIRAAADNAGAPGIWTDWVGPDGNSGSYWNSVNTYAGGCSGTGAISCTTLPAILRNGSGNQWLQYKIVLVSTGFNQALLSDIGIYYETGAAAGAKVILSTTTLSTTEDVGVTPTDTFTVSLDADPASPVTMLFSSGDLTEGTVSPSSLTFSAGDIGPKTVTVTSVDDAVRDLDIAYTVFTSATISDDANYNNLVVSDVSVTNVDDDLAAGGVTVTPVTGLVTSEAGATATFSIVLNSAPTQMVTIFASSSDETEGIATPAVIDFTTLNWMTPQIVTVTGQDEVLFDQNVAYTIINSVTSSTDPNYSGLDVPDVSVTNTDNEAAEVTITADDVVNGLTVNENGGARTFGITLASQPQPGTSVMFSLSSSDLTEGSVLPFMPMTFTSSNWNVPQLGTVFGVEDNVIDGDVDFNIVTSAFISSDSNFNGINPPDIVATNVDNDGVYTITVSPVTGLATTEDGGYEIFNVTLSSAPSADVIISLTSSDPGEGFVKDYVVLTPDGITWRGETVRVTGIDDNIVDADQAYTIVTGVAVSADPNFNGIDPADVSLTNTSTNAKYIDLGQAGANAGRSVAYADVNGDGYDDAVVGAPNYDGSFANGGQVVVYHGSSNGVVYASSWSAEGDQLDAFFGHAVANAGDVNKDGYEDIIVGAYGHDNGGVDEGQVYIYHGSASGLEATPARTLSSAVGSALFGYSVASAGDVDNDTYSDVIIGAYGEDKVYIYHGSAGGIAATAAQTLTGDQVGSQFGISVSGAVDVNGDNYDDVIVGASLYDNGNTDEGRVFAFHGGAAGVVASVAWSMDVDQDNAYFGHSVAGVGDVNKDGYDDVLIGAYGYDNGHTDEGRIYAYLGSASGLSATVNAAIESNQDGAFYGYAVGRAGDVNNDGYDDVIVGAPSYDNGEANEGRAIVYYGSASGVNSTVGLSFESDQADANLGVSVSGGGYFNGDSYADLIAGADLYDATQTDEGRGFMYRSPPQAFGVTVTPTSGLQTSEAGGSTTFTVVLDAPPSANVVVESFVGDASEGKIASSALMTFTPVNWNVPQTILISSVNDDIDDGDVFYNIVSIARSSDSNYDGFAVDTVSVMNSNDDFSVNVAATDMSIAETGADTGTFTFSRTGGLSASLNVFFAVGGTAVNSIDYSGLFGFAVIPAGQSSVDVVVTPADDAFIDPGETVSVTVLSHANYLLGTNITAAMTIVDNDAAGITVSPVTGLVTNEAGGSASFTVVLNTAPSVDVSIALSSDTTAEGLPSIGSLTFTSGNWNVPQTVTVTGQNDAVIDGDVPYNIITAAAVSGDGNYSGVNASDVALTNADDDVLPNISIAATTANISEAGGTGTIRVSRTGSTAAALTVNFSTSSSTATSGEDYYVIGTAVVIPAGSSSVDIAVVAIDDAAVEGDESVTASLVNGSGYIVAQANTATVIIDDDDQLQLPVANFALDQSVGDGSSVTVNVFLDLPAVDAVTYPVSIPYTVTGTAANPADHDAASGTIVIPSGKTASLPFNVVDDGLGDADQTVIFTMGTLVNAVSGAHNSHTVTIIEDNKIPKVTFGVSQFGNTNLIASGNGDVTITATVDDPNPTDTHTYDWSLSNNNLVDIADGDPATFVFSPAALLDGFYKVRLKVTDDGAPAAFAEVDLLLEVKLIVPTLTTADTDGDGVSDDAEAFYDLDSDGIPDYMDSSTLASNELQMDVNREDYVMRTDAGLTLRLGDVAVAAGSDGAEVQVSEIASYGGGEADPGTASAVDTVANTGGYYDFEIIGLPDAGQSVRVVIPQLAPLPNGAVYRKYDPTTGWQDFVIDANNEVASAPGQAGVCPLPGDAAFTAGLTEGHNCIQLTIEDGGGNDMDGVANHVIEDPAQLGGVQVVTSPAASSGSGGGAVSAQWLLLLVIYLSWGIFARGLLRVRRQSH